MSAVPKTPTTFGDLVTALRRRTWIIVVVALAALVASIAASSSATKKYTASASLLFRNQGFDETIFGSTAFTPSNDPARDAATNARLVALGIAQGRVQERVGKQLDISPEAVASQVSVSQEGLADLVTVNATTPDREGAAKLANAFAKQFIAFRREADRSRVDQALTLIRGRIAAQTPVESASANGRELRSREQQLATLGALQTGNAELAQPASVPAHPSSPRPVRSAALSLFAGTILGLALALLLDRIDRRVRSEDEIREALDTRVIGVLPTHKSLSGRQRFVDDPRSIGVEATYSLRTNLRLLDPEQQLKTVVVTSAVSGEGKSTVCWSLATAMAQTGARVLLLEADFRAPSLARLVYLPSSPGLSAVLNGDATPADAIVEMPAGEAEAAHQFARALNVLPAGALAVNPADLVESTAMKVLLAELRADYDKVIIDTPPVTLVSDALTLIPRVDSVIVVSRLGVTKRDDLTRLRVTLRTLGIQVLGVVVNNAAPVAKYGYGTSRKRRWF